MKKNEALFMCMCICILWSGCLVGQDRMKVDSILKSQGEVFVIKLKKQKHHFGPYKIEKRRKSDPKAKDGALYKAYKSRKERGDILTKSAYSVICNGSDTVRVVAIHFLELIKEEKKRVTVFRNSLIPRRPKVTVQYYKQSLRTSFGSINDDVNWNMLLTNPHIPDWEVDSDENGGSTSVLDLNFKDETKFYDEFQFEGRLYGDDDVIKIKRINEWEQEKDRGKDENDCCKQYIGYEFYLDGRAIAAVQLKPYRIGKMKVWMLEDLDTKMKNVLVTAILSMVKIHGYDHTL